MLKEFAYDLGDYDFVSKVVLGKVPILGVVAGALASWLVAGRSVYRNSITAARST